MISGRIRRREAIIDLEVSGPGEASQHIEAVIDTGFNGHLTLPEHVVAALSLSFAGHRRGTLADGSVIRLDVYFAQVVWHGQQKEVLISEAAGKPLLGMSLLEGSQLTMNVKERGSVTIEAFS